VQEIYRGLFQGTVRRTIKASVTIADLRTEIRTWDISNAKQE